jgi:hypothetical protein
MDVLKYTNVDFILDRLFRDYPYEDQKVDRNSIIEWIGDVLELLPLKQRLYRKVTDCTDNANPNVIVSNYTGTLPCDLKRILQVVAVDINGDEKRVTLKKSTDLYITRFNNTHDDNPEDQIKAYYVKNNIIHTNFEDGELEIAYEAVPMDEEGFPLIPDVEQVIDAIVKFIAYKISFIMLLKKEEGSGSLYTELKAQFDNAFRKACSILQMPDEDDMANIGAHWVKMGRSPFDRKYNYKYKGNRGR